MKDPKSLKIYKYGKEVLGLKAKEIGNIDQKISDLVENMRYTMYASGNGVGLAAPQVGESIQLSVIDISMGENPEDFILLINPEILESDGSEVGDEGCLSLPGFSMPVKRKSKVLLKSLDINGNEWQKEYDGFIARVLQHEIDHLHGILIIDKVSSLKKQMLKKEIRKLERDGLWD